MRVQRGIVGYDDGVLGDKHGFCIEFERLRTRAGGFGDCDGGVETYRLKLVAMC